MIKEKIVWRWKQDKSNFFTYIMNHDATHSIVQL